MLNSYQDITEKISEAPRWFDEAGVPRYCDFDPDQAHSIYASEVALLLIACQGCGREYKVAFSWDRLTSYMQHGREVPPMSERVHDLHYGDPPCFECLAGATMNCIDLRVLEFWKRALSEWVRVPELEVGLEDAG